MMTLDDLGYNSQLEEFRKELDLESFDLGRVTSEHKDRYTVKNESGEFEAEVIGNLRYTAEKQSDFPSVGDWVAISEYDENKALIHAVLPRKNSIEREAVGRQGETQVIATNIDTAFIVQAADRDFNINRLERYLTICRKSLIRPIIVLSKIDLANDLQPDDFVELIRSRIENIPVMAVSNQTLSGIQELKGMIEKGKTYCFLGSSGVGKSTLINNLSGGTILKTGMISESTNKGRHITSRRELIVLEGGGILIDNPGMREVGIADAAGGLEDTFDYILKRSTGCRFKDCTHVHESGCAILEAVQAGEIDMDSYENYLKLEREKAHFESSITEKRRKDKDFGKMIKNVKKDMRRLDG